jgi:hypothetical protein
MIIELFDIWCLEFGPVRAGWVLGFGVCLIFGACNLVFVFYDLGFIQRSFYHRRLHFQTLFISKSTFLI